MTADGVKKSLLSRRRPRHAQLQATANSLTSCEVVTIVNGCSSMTKTQCHLHACDAVFVWPILCVRIVSHRTLGINFCDRETFHEEDWDFSVTLLVSISTFQLPALAIYYNSKDLTPPDSTWKRPRGGASKTLMVTSRVQGHWHVGHWCWLWHWHKIEICGEQSMYYGLWARRTMMMMMRHSTLDIWPFLHSNLMSEHQRFRLIAINYELLLFLWGLRVPLICYKSW